jgi:trk system potassium uptake protein TrkH
MMENEALQTGKVNIIQLFFEVVSAFGTVGLSIGATYTFQPWTKFILICTMFAGRVGLFTMSIPTSRKRIERYVDYPEESIMIG